MAINKQEIELTAKGLGCTRMAQEMAERCESIANDFKKMGFSRDPHSNKQKDAQEVVGLMTAAAGAARDGDYERMAELSRQAGNKAKGAGLNSRALNKQVDRSEGFLNALKTYEGLADGAKQAVGNRAKDIVGKELAAADKKADKKREALRPAKGAGEEPEKGLSARPR